MNRAHRCLEGLLAEAESRHLFDLLDTLRATAQKMRSAEGVCRVEVDPFIRFGAHGFKLERWARSHANISRSLQLLGERVCDAFIGSLYELELERGRKIVQFQGQQMIVEALVRTPLWRVAPRLAAATIGSNGFDRLALDPTLHHPRLVRRLETEGYRILPATIRKSRQHDHTVARVVNQLQVHALPKPHAYCLLDQAPIDEDVIGIAYSATYAEQQPSFKTLMQQVTQHLRQCLKEELQLSSKNLLPLAC
ncbi:hypothetical protein [Synechococcus sp. ATX 2A4]|uniref:hypothetical protein n=1 Tax=Synechococcus sp. ATX 2A4 TaxID=2823727 RepID=UPI0020CB8A74|nr:hypothetical protein [Synechococcus sp. ATX 2A4]